MRPTQPAAAAVLFSCLSEAMQCIAPTIPTTPPSHPVQATGGSVQQQRPPRQPLWPAPAGGHPWGLSPSAACSPLLREMWRRFMWPPSWALAPSWRRLSLQKRCRPSFAFSSSGSALLLQRLFGGSSPATATAGGLRLAWACSNRLVGSSCFGGLASGRSLSHQLHPTHTMIGDFCESLSRILPARPFVELRLQLQPRIGTLCFKRQPVLACLHARSPPAGPACPLRLPPRCGLPTGAAKFSIASLRV